MKNKENNENATMLESFKSLLSKALTRESDPSKVFAFLYRKRFYIEIKGRIFHNFALVSTILWNNIWIIGGFLPFDRNFGYNLVVFIKLQFIFFILFFHCKVHGIKYWVNIFLYQ